MGGARPTLKGRGLRAVRGATLQGGRAVVCRQTLVAWGFRHDASGRRLGRRKGLLGAGHHDGADQRHGQPEVAQRVPPGKPVEVALRFVLVDAVEDHAGDA